MTDSANAWTEERLVQLRKLWDEGLSISQIGDALGVSRNAIAGKAHRMGLPKRPSPISKTAKETKKPAKPKPAAEPENLPLRLELAALDATRAAPSCRPKRHSSFGSLQPSVAISASRSATSCLRACCVGRERIQKSS